MKTGFEEALIASARVECVLTRGEEGVVRDWEERDQPVDPAVGFEFTVLLVVLVIGAAALVWELLGPR